MLQGARDAKRKPRCAGGGALSYLAAQVAGTRAQKGRALLTLCIPFGSRVQVWPFGTCSLEFQLPLSTLHDSYHHDGRTADTMSALGLGACELCGSETECVYGTDVCASSQLYAGDGR